MLVMVWASGISGAWFRNIAWHFCTTCCIRFQKYCHAIYFQQSGSSLVCAANKGHPKFDAFTQGGDNDEKASDPDPSEHKKLISW